MQTPETMKICSSIPELDSFKSRLIICNVPVKLDFLVAARFNLKSNKDWKKSFSKDLELSFQQPCVYILHNESSYTVILYVPDGLMRLPSPLKLEMQSENEASLILWHGLCRLTSYSVDLPKNHLSDIFDVYLSSVQCACILYSAPSPDLQIIQNQLTAHQGNFHADFPVIKLGRNMACQSNIQQNDFSAQCATQSSSVACSVNTLNQDQLNAQINKYHFNSLKQQLLKNKSQVELMEQKIFVKDIMQTAMSFIKDLINYRQQRVNALEQLLSLRNAEIADLNEKNKLLSKIHSTSNFTSKQVVKLTHTLEDDKEELRMDQHQHWTDFKKLMQIQSAQLKTIFESSLKEMVQVVGGKDQMEALDNKLDHQNTMYAKVFQDMDRHLSVLKTNQKQQLSTETNEIANKIDQLVRLTRSYEIEKVKYAEALKDMEQVQQDRNRLNNENEGLMDKLEDQSAAFESLKTQQQQLSTNARLLETENLKLKKQKSNLEMELENVRNELRLEKEDLHVLEDSNTSQIKRNRQLVERYRTELEQIKKSNNELEEEKYENNKLLDQLQHQLKQTTKKLEKEVGQESGLEVLQDELDFMQLKLKNEQDLKMALKRENDDLTDRLMLLEKKASIEKSANRPKTVKTTKITKITKSPSLTPPELHEMEETSEAIPKKRVVEGRPKRERKKPKFQEYNEMISSDKIQIPQQQERIPLRKMDSVMFNVNYN